MEFGQLSTDSDAAVAEDRERVGQHRTEPMGGFEEHERLLKGRRFRERGAAGAGGARQEAEEVERIRLQPRDGERRRKATAEGPGTATT